MVGRGGESAEDAKVPFLALYVSVLIPDGSKSRLCKIE